MNKKNPLQGKTGSALVSVFSSLICIIIGLILGYAILLIMNPKIAYEEGFNKLILSGFRLYTEGDKTSGIGKEIVEATLVAERKAHVHIYMKAYPTDAYSINLDMKLPDTEMELLVTIVKAIGNGHLGITKIIVE